MVERNVYDVQSRARFYAWVPYGHYKQEVYAYQAMALATVGAGPVARLGAASCRTMARFPAGHLR